MHRRWTKEDTAMQTSWSFCSRCWGFCLKNNAEMNACCRRCLLLLLLVIVVTYSNERRTRTFQCGAANVPCKKQRSSQRLAPQLWIWNLLSAALIIIQLKMKWNRTKLWATSLHFYYANVCVCLFCICIGSCQSLNSVYCNQFKRADWTGEHALCVCVRMHNDILHAIDMKMMMNRNRQTETQLNKNL